MLGLVNMELSHKISYRDYKKGYFGNGIWVFLKKVHFDSWPARKVWAGGEKSRCHGKCFFGAKSHTRSVTIGLAVASGPKRVQIASETRVLQVGGGI